VMLTLPTLPFFGMHHSESALTLAAFIMTGYAAFALAMNAPSRWHGPVLGLALALIAAGPRHGWPALVIVAALAATRLVSSPAPRDSHAGTAWLWGGLAAPAVVLLASRFLWIPSPFYEQWKLTGFDPRSGLSSASFLTLLGAAALTGALLERLIARLPLVPRAAAWIARTICAALAVTIVVTLAASIWIDLPDLKPVETAKPDSALSYTRSVLLALVTAARVRSFDFLTWTSLWGGFGWADAVLPSPAVAIVTVTIAAAGALTLVTAARQRDAAIARAASLGLLGIAASIAAAAISSYGLHRNVHGRYLLGACVIGLCLVVAPWWVGDGRRAPRGGRTAVLLGLCCALHAYAIGFLLEKYFG
jgi:hypothetical protein